MPRRNGAPNYKTDLLIVIVESLKPKGADGWKRVAVLYQQDSGETMLRDQKPLDREVVLHEFGFKFGGDVFDDAKNFIFCDFSELGLLSLNCFVVDGCHDNTNKLLNGVLDFRETIIVAP